MFPNTAPSSHHSISLSLAGGEYQGFIIGLHGSAARHVSVVWVDDPVAGTPSDPFLVQNAVLDQVAFVHIKRPTSGTGAKAGLYPDPLLPRTFGQRLAMPAHSSSLYVLLHVPYTADNANAGTYSGTLEVTNGIEKVDLSVALKVWDFGWPRLSTRTAFQVNFNNLGGNQVDDYAFLQQHGVTPLMPRATPKVELERQHHAGGLHRPSAPVPGQRRPRHGQRPPAVARLVSGLPMEVRGRQRAPAELPHQRLPCVRRQRLAGQARRLPGRRARRASPRNATPTRSPARCTRPAPRPAFRAQFLLTDDPRPTNLGALLPANKYLWKDVDIWALRYYYFFGRVPVLKQVRADGAAGLVVSVLQPERRPHAQLRDRQVARRRTRVGLAHAAVERRRPALLGRQPLGQRADRRRGGRDPYKDPISFIWSDGRVCNGEASIIYPGYYPRYGLNDKNAVPVSSLRLEAFRDGMEDKEYLKLATTLRGTKFVAAVIKSITTYPYKVQYGHLFNFPKYVTSASSLRRGP